jgi:hypothetical protein
MVRGTFTMMITTVDRTQQGQNVNTVRAEEMISKRERDREKLMAHNWRIIHSNEEVEMAFRYWLQMQESYSYRDGIFLPRVRFGVVSVLLAYVEKRQFGGIYEAHFTQ